MKIASDERMKAGGKLSFPFSACVFLRSSHCNVLHLRVWKSLFYAVVIKRKKRNKYNFFTFPLYLYHKVYCFSINFYFSWIFVFFILQCMLFLLWIFSFREPRKDERGRRRNTSSNRPLSLDNLDAFHMLCIEKGAEGQEMSYARFLHQSHNQETGR